jgi:predicted DNA-binding transcriptional regulator YafY
MNKLSKTERLELILALLRDSKRALSISEIHEALTRDSLGEISRKTIQRDLREMLQKCTVKISTDSTLYEFSARPLNELRLELTNEEATYLIVVLPQEHSVNQRLRKMMGF